jgi:hypothetical protein
LAVRFHYNVDEKKITALSVSQAWRDPNREGKIRISTPSRDKGEYGVLVVEPLVPNGTEFFTASYKQFSECVSDLSIESKEIPGPDEKDTVRVLSAPCITDSIMQKWNLNG